MKSSLRPLAWYLLVSGILSIIIPLQASKTNIIAIVTDDQATWSLGAYGNSDPMTPHMDRLAREGILFSRAFVCSPVCSPSRATYLTGKYPTQIGITDWIAPSEAAAGLGLPEHLPTWPEVLQKHGYSTGLIGKWHLGDQPTFHPKRRGFDHFFGFLGGGNTPMHPMLERQGVTRRFEGYGADLLTDDALAFIEEHQRRPFALLLHFREPHAPYAPVPDSDAAVFESLDPSLPEASAMNTSQLKKWTREYHASVRSVDRNLGRILLHLDQLNLASETIVLFTSDHGYMIGHHGLRHKGNAHWYAGGVRGPKRPNMFEYSIRVPWIMRWPGVIQPGKRIDELVSQVDMFASVLGMLQIPMPDGYEQEGHDLSGLVMGESHVARRFIFGQYDLHNNGLAYMRMIRTKKWKLVRHFKTHFMDELYNLEEDPDETRNLYRQSRFATVRASLADLLALKMQQVSDPLLGDVY